VEGGQRSALVTGAASGIGAAIALAYAAAGARLVLADLNAQRLAQQADACRAHGVVVETVQADVGEEAGADAIVGRSIEAFGGIDVLVNNAGYGNVDSVEDTPLADFRRQIETNLFGTIIMTKAAIPVMRGQGAGHIIQFSSVGGRIGPVGRAPYAAAKWGVEGFSEVLSKEVGPLGIKVTVIEPGGFRTDFAGSSTAIYEGRPEYAETVGAMAEYQRNYNGRQPGDPARAAAAVLHIASLDTPPLRLLLGSDAAAAVEKADAARMEADRSWRVVSQSTDFEQSGDARPMPWDKKAG